MWASRLLPGQVLGLVGENGSGKSTTMNILGGVHQPDRGAMTIDGRLTRRAARATPRRAASRSSIRNSTSSRT